MAHHLRRLSAAASALMLVPAANALAQAATPAALAPHRAVYEITLDKAKNGAGMSDLSGRMVYELTGSACDGYTQTMRFVTRMTSQEGDASLNDLRSSTFEDVDALKFKFSGEHGGRCDPRGRKGRDQGRCDKAEEGRPHGSSEHAVSCAALDCDARRRTRW
jgi:hypothetical protein